MIFSPRFVQIGFIEKTHGTKGWLKINNSENSISTEMEFLFLEQSGQKVPFKVSDFNAISNLIKFTQFNNPEDAQKFANTGIFIIAEKTAPTKERELVGFKLLDQNNNKVGIIKGWEDIPGNPLLLVETEKEQVYLPFNADLILELDHKNEQLVYQMLDGLLEL